MFVFWVIVQLPDVWQSAWPKFCCVPRCHCSVEVWRSWLSRCCRSAWPFPDPEMPVELAAPWCWNFPTPTGPYCVWVNLQDVRRVWQVREGEQAVSVRPPRQHPHCVSVWAESRSRGPAVLVHGADETARRLAGAGANRTLRLADRSAGVFAIAVCVLVCEAGGVAPPGTATRIAAGALEAGGLLRAIGHRFGSRSRPRHHTSRARSSFCVIALLAQSTSSILRQRRRVTPDAGQWVSAFSAVLSPAAEPA
jgi:hypothetical protein